VEDGAVEEAGVHVLEEVLGGDGRLVGIELQLDHPE
jgi:hypothetical protein